MVQSKSNDSSLLFASISFITLIGAQVILAHAPAAGRLANIDGYYQLRRKLQHISSGLAICFVYTYILDPWTSSMTCFIACLFMFTLHILRLYYKPLNEFLIRAFHGLLRPHEMYSLPGAFYMVAGFGCSIALFDTPIVTLGMLYISIGDPLASFVGQYVHHDTPSSQPLSHPNPWKHRFINGKSGAGFITMATVCITVTAVYVESSQSVSSTISSSPVNVAYWSLTGGLTAAVIELYGGSPLPWFMFPNSSLFRVDDNFVVPVMCTTLLSICQYVSVLPHI